MQGTITTNAELIRRGYEAFNKGDLKTLTELFDPNATWHTPGRGSIGGDRKGLEAVFGQFGRYGAETQGTFRAELKYVLADDEGRAIAVHHNTGERNGKRLSVDCCLAFEIRDGRVVSGKEHFYDLGAWETFWA